MTTTALSSGIYRIEVVGGVEVGCLTYESGDVVTILPPSAQLSSEQEWRIICAKDGNIIIERSPIRPGTYLTYEGAPEKPKEGDRIICRLYEIPLNEWHLSAASELIFFIRVAGSDLGIKVAPLTVSPPRLELGLKDQLKWLFIRVRDE